MKLGLVVLSKMKIIRFLFEWLAKENVKVIGEG